jgi:hypothetical protein
VPSSTHVKGITSAAPGCTKTGFITRLADEHLQTALLECLLHVGSAHNRKSVANYRFAAHFSALSSSTLRSGSVRLPRRFDPPTTRPCPWSRAGPPTNTGGANGESPGKPRTPRGSSVSHLKEWRNLSFTLHGGTTRATAGGMTESFLARSGTDCPGLRWSTGIEARHRHSNYASRRCPYKAPSIVLAPLGRGSLFLPLPYHHPCNWRSVTFAFGYRRTAAQ